jgi:hypothetical protein
MKRGVNYAGKLGEKCWVARIVGTSPGRFHFDREFIDPDTRERNKYNSSRYLETLTWHLDVGMYERACQGERAFFTVWIKEGEHVWMNIPVERAEKIAALMSSGASAEDARLATRAPQK